ncbi:CPXCG motif-containing cysteine-rich protein [Wenyingzhuangia sp. IMCC45533]
MEYNFTCPYCWENIDMLLEFTVSETYIQDCEICCNPIEIETKWEDDSLISVTVHPIGQ